MVRFLIKFLCIFYVTAAVNPRSLSYNLEKEDKIDDEIDSQTKDITVQNKRKATHTTSQLERILTNATRNLNRLKEIYGSDSYKTYFPKHDKILYQYEPTKTTRTTTFDATDEADFLGTAQIEELLNDIKARAIEMVAEQNPAVSDIITNTVTEATFEADPILTHLDVSSPGYALTTFVFLNNIENIDKRTANESNLVLIPNNEDKHKVTVRSFKEDAYTIAQSVECMLQNELKNVYMKVKNKVSKDFHKEIEQAKSTIISHYPFTKTKGTKVTKSPISTKDTKGTNLIVQEYKMTTPLPSSKKITTKHLKKTTKKPVNTRKNRGGKTTKLTTKNTKSTETYTITPTVDDFAMLTLYEQILAKTHEDNVMKLLTVNNKRKIDNIVRLSKRNPETLTDLNLKEDIRKLYEDGDNIPDIDYSKEIISDSNDNETHDYSYDSDSNSKDNDQTTESTTAEGTSYEGLSDKIAFKDYVNGYKSYLDFQKEQGVSNFSNLVKYQAHKHHKVDDIGKFILNKIPQIPLRQRRFFYDNSDMDELDVSTKSDDSWFKKHFYMFIDDNSPKKYHTSETVALKDVEKHKHKASYRKDDEDTQTMRITVGWKKKSTNAAAADINLDELATALKKYKLSDTHLFQNDIAYTTPDTEQNLDEDRGKLLKFFGKHQTDLENENEESNDNDLFYDDDDNFLFNSDLDRRRRKAEETSKKGCKVPRTTNLPNKDIKYKTKSGDKMKDGYISLVTQPTAIVNLHKTNVQGSKIKRLLSKLHFHRKNKKKIKQKRHCTRVQRFNAMKKLKNIFLPKANARIIEPVKSVSDYDMITSHIDTFKSVNYERIPSIDELRKQVPNITEDLININDMIVAKEYDEWRYSKGLNKTAARVHPKKAKKIYKMGKLKSQHPYELVETKAKQSTGNNAMNTKKFNKNTFLKDNIPTDDVMNVKIETFPQNDEIYTMLPAALKDVKDEIYLLQQKLATEQYHLKNYPRTSLKYKQKTEYNNNENDFNNSGITLRAVLAKYPIIKVINKKDVTNPVADVPKLNELVDDDDNSLIDNEDPSQSSKKRTLFYKPTTYNRNKFASSTSIIDGILNNLNYYDEFNKVMNNVDNTDKIKVNPDYFNDLLVWNSDILNYNIDLSPKWQDILKDFQPNCQYTTPNIKDMQNELNEMNKYILLGPSPVTMKISTKPVANDGKIIVNDMKNDTFAEFDDDPFQVSTIKSYITARSHDLLDVLNKLYDSQNSKISAEKPKAYGKLKIDNDPKFERYRDSSNRATLKDNFRVDAEGLPPKKIYKNSLILSKKHTMSHPIAQLNKQPKQYFHTPLPMSNHQFEKFLKENQIDVEYVTSPMFNLPTTSETWQTWQHNKANPYAKLVTNTHTEINKKNKSKDDLMDNIKLGDNMGIWHSNLKPTGKLNIYTGTTKVTKSKEHKMDIKNVEDVNSIEEVIDKSYPEHQIEYLNDLERDLFNDYPDNFNVRYKRSSMHDYDIQTEETMTSKNENNEFKNEENNVLGKKQEVTTEHIRLSKENKPNETEVEITIINFDAINKNNGKLLIDPLKLWLQSNSTIENSKNKDASVKILSTPTISPKESGDIKNVRKKNAKSLVTKNAHINSIESSDIKEVANEIQMNDKETSKDEVHLPNTVQITRSSITYDVLFNVPNDKENADKENIGHTHSTRSMTDRNRDSSTNSDFQRPQTIRNIKTISNRNGIMNIIDIVKAVDNFTRPNVNIHIELPTFYAPNNSIHDTDIRINVNKTSWTDLVLKYVTGIALIEMLTKLGVLSGGLNFTDGLDVDFDRVKVFRDVMDDAGKPRTERAAKTTKKRNTFSQTLHFTRDMRKARKKRMFALHPTKNKLKPPTSSLDLISSEGTAQDKSLSWQIKDVGDIYDQTYNLFLKKTTTTPIAAHTLDAIVEKTVKLLTSHQETENEDISWKQRMKTYEDSEDNDDNYDLVENIEHQKNSSKKTKGGRNLGSPFITTLKTEKKKKKKLKDKSGVTIEIKFNDALADMKTREKLADEKVSEIDDKSGIESSTNKIHKREAFRTYTAKNVAALEIVVDLVKDSQKENNKDYKHFLYYDDVWNPNKCPTGHCENTESTNSIQICIAVPSGDGKNKRSVESSKVRKVFSAKMLTPVDLEYQIHSVENTPSTTVREKLFPGVYLIVDNPNNVKGGLPLKPLKLSRIKNSEEAIKSREEQTKPEKIKLSKEFVAAVNRHLIQLYENMSAVNDIEDKSVTHNVTRREISWNKVRKFFGRNAICKCKENKTMCRECASIDAVVKELSFEFDNLAKYINDHCSEIQTFFRVNPKGGKVLKDLISGIDQSINNYYKQVKGKCRGQSCKVLCTHMDKRKRDLNKTTKECKNIDGLLNDLQSLCSDFDILSKFIGYDTFLKKKGDNFIRTARNCIHTNKISKRSSNNEDGRDQNAYSLDNISVKLICNPHSSTDSINTSPMSFLDMTTDKAEVLLDYDVKTNLIKNFFTIKNTPKSEKLFTYYIKHDGTTADGFDKREIKQDQVESPLIADTGGSFWLDYLRKGNANVNNNNSEKIAVVQINTEETTIKSKSKSSEKNKVLNLSTTAELVANTMDSLDSKMNKLFKLIGKVREPTTKADVKTPEKTTKKNKNVNKKPKKNKTKKIKKNHNKVTKPKHHKPKVKKTVITADINTTCQTNADIDTTKLKDNQKTTLENFYKKEVSSELTTPLTTEAQLSTETRGFYEKVKMATLDFFHYTDAGTKVYKDYITPAESDLLETIKTKDVKNDKKTMNVKNKVDTDVISNVTKQLNPTKILRKENKKTKDKKPKEIKKSRKIKSILLSLLNFESDKLDNERKIVKKEIEEKINEDERNEDELVEYISQLKTKPNQSIETIGTNVDVSKGKVDSIDTRARMFNWFANKFGVKVTDVKAAATPILKGSKTTSAMKDVTDKTMDFEEADPLKTLNIIVNTKPSNDTASQYDREGKYVGKRRKKRKRRLDLNDEENTRIDKSIDTRDVYRGNVRKTTVNCDRNNRKEELHNNFKNDKPKGTVQDFDKKMRNDKTIVRAVEFDRRGDFTEENEDEVNERRFLRKSTRDEFTEDTETQDLDKRILRKETVEYRKTVTGAEFDRFIEGDDGVYRWKRNKKEIEKSNFLTSANYALSTYTGSGFGQKTVKNHLADRKRSVSKDYKWYGRTRRKHKRSSGSESKKSSILSTWIRNTTVGSILASIVIFYMFFAVISALISWAFLLF